MKQYPKPLAKLIGELSKLPGIGYKTAQRLAFHILAQDEEQARALADAITTAKEEMKYCSVCGNLTDQDPCIICSDMSRKRDIICIVESPKDVMAMERIRDFDGLYHVLHGVISPMEGVGPEDINLKSLITRLQQEDVKELIVATKRDEKLSAAEKADKVKKHEETIAELQKKAKEQTAALLAEMKEAAQRAKVRFSGK